MIFDELGSEFLLSSLSHALESDNEDVLRQVRSLPLSIPPRLVTPSPPPPHKN